MDEAAFHDLFREHFADVWRFARRRCASGHEADDVTAETFAVAWRRRAGVPPAPDARLWLFGTARLVLANRRRSDDRRSRLDLRLAGEPGPTVADPAAVVVDAVGRRLAGALSSLSGDDRELLILRAWDGLSVTDIAALLGCTPNAASGRLHKARGRLAALLAEADDSEGTPRSAVPTDEPQREAVADD
ncbi:MAG: sigma-70 family RNA polymerase sigma factor [Acidimicrobiales bacterium]|nr:sigma-70 family RNA polymerase sigma factor [Acidimicrobiales bacterium]